MKMSIELKHLSLSSSSQFTIHDNINKMKATVFFTTTLTSLGRAFSPYSSLRATSSPHYNIMFRPLHARLFYSKQDMNKEPHIHTKSYKIQGIGQGSAVEMKTNTNHKLSTDVPIKMGGKDTSPQPVELLLASLIGCTQATAIYVGRMMKPRLLVDKIEFDLTACRDERGALALPIDKAPPIAARLESISGTVKVYFKKGVNPTQNEFLILKEQTEARCPVANMIHASGCKTDIEWTDETKI